MANTLKLGAGKWATGTDTVLAFNDENNNFKPLPFDFSRASSATVVNQSGLIETVGSGEPRIDFLGNTKGALLLEPSRTNLIPYSEDFSVANWTKSNATITSNSIISPDGTSNADKLVENTSNASHQVYDTVITNSGGYSNSIFVKAAERSKIRINSGSNSDRVDFDLSNGTVISQLGATGNIVSVSNGWYKCDISWNTATVSAQYFLISLLDDSGTQQYQGDGTSGVYIWGAQLEVGSYATSYIPTSGSAVTRVADACYNDNLTNVIGQTEGTFYLETVPLNTATNWTERVIQFESSGAGFMTIQRYSNQNITFYGTNGSNSWSIQGNGLFVGGQTIKIAGAYKNNDIALYVNGVQIGTNTTANAPQTEKLRFANNSIGGLGYVGSHKDVKLYNTRLSNAELQALTTI
jgi:hypothetical protein